MDSKINQNLTWNNPSWLLPIQKVLKSNLNSIVTLPQKLNESCSILLNFFGVLRFVINIRHNFCKTFSIFCHNLHMWYHDIMTNLMIFRVHLFFIEFKTYSVHIPGNVLRTRYLNFRFKSSTLTPIGLNNININFFIHYSILLQTVAVQI